MLQIKNIEFSTIWENLENDFVDVFVYLQNGACYNITVATPKNIEFLMDNDRLNYFRPGYPFLLVKKLTPEIIEEAIRAYAEYSDGYWLKLYQFSYLIETAVFDQLDAKNIQREVNLKLECQLLKEQCQKLKELKELEQELEKFE